MDDFGQTEAQQTGARRAELFERSAEEIGRIGVALQCQRVELYRINEDRDAMLQAWWAGITHPDSMIPPYSDPLPVSFFPWSLGDHSATHYTFVNNASKLPISPERNISIGDMGFQTALFFHINNGDEVIGGGCCYWVEDLGVPPAWSWHKITEWAHTALEVIAEVTRL